MEEYDWNQESTGLLTACLEMTAETFSSSSSNESRTWPKLSLICPFGVSIPLFTANASIATEAPKNTSFSLRNSLHRQNCQFPALFLQQISNMLLNCCSSVDSACWKNVGKMLKKCWRNVDSLNPAQDVE